uniref:MPN domain-containing protein n=1 Tax=Erythrolobus madagascarensis TaxID=708628 RepID=A0A7S0T5S1_9RHOD|mmetsp:Transcript_3888/g.8546  ORF Transcript_3888/g.8546 Transcript_3888/m.8546 type:complete len:495 (+) Transcript_3888:34-1518(+)
MIVRVRLPDGSTTRVAVDGSASMWEVVKQVLKNGAVDATSTPVLCTDARCTTQLGSSQDESLDSCGVKHGDMLFLRGSMVAGGDENENSGEKVMMRDVDSDKTDGAAAAASTQGGVKNGKQESDKDTQQPKKMRCLHGPRGMCEHCMPKEDPRERYKRELEKWTNQKGSSIAVMEALDALKFRIKPQETARLAAASVDSKAANDFQAYLVTIAFSQHRIGYIYGTVDDENVAHCDVIYEPPQIGTADAYAVVEDEENGDDEGGKESGEKAVGISKRADAVARGLGLVQVGMIFSAKPRKCILSAVDILTAAKLAVAEGARRPGAEKEFVIISVALAEDGQTLFEAFQLSDQCLEMFRAGAFLEAEKQKPNSGRVKVRDAVFVEGKETHAVHTEFFLMNVPIRGHDSRFRSGAFPVANRELRAQQQTDLVDALRAHNDKPFHEKLADFHLLVFLSAILDVHTDMPGLCALIRDRREPTELEAGYKLMLDAICVNS